MPVTKRDGDLEFMLTDLTTGLTPKDVAADSRRELTTTYGSLVSRSRESSWTRASFRITRGGKPETAWEPVGVSLSDATGNAFTAYFRAPFRDGDRARLYFGGTLWPDEPAWKLKVTFARAHGFAPAELWTVPGIPVPEAGDSGYPAASTTRRG